MNIFEKIVIYGFLGINQKRKVKQWVAGTKIYFVPTDADIVRETIIRGCVKNDKGERFLIIDPSDKKLDFESLKLKDDNHIYTNKADAEKHLQDLLEEQGK